MIPIVDFERRALSGPVMKSEEFDLALSWRLRKLVDEYEIKYDPESLIADDATADAVFQAAVDLLVDIGLYHIDTRRVIKFEREEVLTIAREAWEGPRQEIFGTGKEEVVIKFRGSEDPTPPTIWMGGCCRVPEELMVPFIQAFLQEELCQGLWCPAMLESAGGIVAKMGTLSEVHVGLAHVRYYREAAHRAGRPGIFIGPVYSCVAPSGFEAVCCSPDGVGRRNTVIPIYIMPELKIDWTRLLLAQFCEIQGISPYPCANAMLACLCRDGRESAVSMTSALLGGMAYGHANWSTIGLGAQDNSTSRRESLWALSATARASERHIGIPVETNQQSLAGSCTEMAALEKAALTITGVTSGTALIWAQGCRGGQGRLHMTPLDSRLAAETALAVAGMKRAEANALVQRIVPLYEPLLANPPQGKIFTELYDLKTLQPLPEYLKFYDGVKSKLASLGVPYK